MAALSTTQFPRVCNMSIYCLKGILTALFAGFPEPGKTTVYDETQTIDLETVSLHGGILIKVLELSIDPYLRGRMRDPSVKSYAAAFALGEPYVSVFLAGLRCFNLVE